MSLALHYLIENPTKAYGQDFIRRMHARFGARAVCFYTSDEALPHSAKLYPELFSKDYVAAQYRVTPEALPQFIEYQRSHYSIKAVIPHHESFVCNAVTVAESLGLDWVQPVIMRRFRDKFSLKSHLRATDPSLRINFAQLTSSPSETLEIVRNNRLNRYVLKPNDGSGNIGIGIFSAQDQPSLIEEYWKRTQAGTVLLEEFIEGREYHCNGQVDAEGNITIIDIGRTHYTETELGEIVCLRTDQLPSTAPEFIPIADYTRRVIQASGLRRSPFHAELRVDDSGPSLLECAARVIGASCARFTTEMHSPQFDMIDLAAHYYVSSESYGAIGLDWKNYDASQQIKIRGVANQVGKIWQLEGVRETERLPQFMTWTEKPSIGQHLTATNSLVSSSYALITRCHTFAEADEVERKVRELIRWNTRPQSPLERVFYYVGRIPGYIRWKLKQRRQKQPRIIDRVFK